ncbi:hypothetical protein M422DRAFT_227034 [Sphaerobolus stellatus SS14]|uniref:Exonuclease domain-containing protein n=1 Tax=Sphaerobolus stellatus (strain SS14) TaxID=990650 RepID=A0A0C9VEQ3_SPHS4|nr:hypothetical protein M422DRAFT_227034 [Sphaerobolus stellatus SS14]
MALNQRCPTCAYYAVQIFSTTDPLHRTLALSTLCVGTGLGGSTSMLARVSVVDSRGHVLIDTYVQPTMPVADYRTASTGIQPESLTAGSAMNFSEVQRRVAELIRDRILVGYCLWTDLSVLGIAHPAVLTRDVGLFLPFRAALGKQKQLFGLPTLVHHLMRRRIQMRRVDSLENARASLDLYRSYQTNWEEMVSAKQWPCVLPPSTFSRCYL